MKDYRDPDKQELHERLYQLEHLVKHSQDGIDKCFKRIEELESKFKSFIEIYDKLASSFMDDHVTNLDRFMSMEKRLSCFEAVKIQLNKLESKVHSNLVSYSDIQEIHRVLEEHRKRIFRQDKKPHKCPVCKGKGKIKEDLASFVNCKEILFDCKSCEGKGIVWG